MAEGSQFLTFMGIRVHYTVHLPEAPLRSRMLLLCSPLMTTFNWRKLLPELSQMGCLAVAVDLPGFGRSDCRMETPQSHDLRASIVWGILDEVDREMGAPLSMWHLAGHGSACATLLKMLNQARDSVKSQIYLNPLLSLAPQGRARQGLLGQYDAIVSSEERFRAQMETYSVQKLEDYVLDRMRKPLIRAGAKATFARMLSQTAADPADQLGFCPTMVIYGQRDPLMDESAMAAMARMLPDAEIHALRSAGHFPMETHSRALRDYLRGWIRFSDQNAL